MPKAVTLIMNAKEVDFNTLIIFEELHSKFQTCKILCKISFSDPGNNVSKEEFIFEGHGEMSRYGRLGGFVILSFG